jgi:glycosyltransferase involved in cell wall biosynthesis
MVFQSSARSSDQTVLGSIALRAFRYLSPVQHQSEILGGYDQILTVSEFSRRWIRRYWGLDSVVLYPPVDVDAFASRPKRQSIVCAGRFFAGNHNKKQDVLAAAFRRAIKGPIRGWELHLAGGYVSTDTNRAFLRAVEKAADGDDSIHFHLNCTVDEIRELYESSKLFWHATGFGESDEDHPERFEHFGITTIEAMAAGCVPLSYRGGGQPEVIQSGSNGVLWSTLDELIAESARLGTDYSRQKAMAEAARTRAKDFSTAVFRERLADIVDAARAADVGS